MYFEQNQNQEQKQKQRDLKIKELELLIESLDRQEDQLMGSFNVSANQLTTFVNNKENFTDENWQEVTKQKILFEEKLNKEIHNIRDPLKTKKAFSSLHVKRHWLHVK